MTLNPASSRRPAWVCRAATARRSLAPGLWILIAALLPGHTVIAQVTGAAQTDPPAVCASNSGDFATTFDFTLPNGAPALRYRYSSDSGRWDFALPRVSGVLNALSYLNPSGCTTPLIQVPGDPERYVSSSGVQFEYKSGQLRLLGHDGAILRFTEGAGSVRVPLTITSKVGSIDAFRYSEGKLISLELNRHPLAPAPRFIVDIQRNGSGAVTAVRVYDGARTKVLHSYELRYRAVGGSPVLIAITTRGSDGSIVKTAAFGYDTRSNRPLLASIDEAPNGARTVIDYTQQILGVPMGGVRTVVKSTRRLLGAGSEPRVNEYTYEGGEISNGVFTGFAAISRTSGVQKTRTSFLTAPHEAIGLPIGFEVSERPNGQLTAITKFEYDVGGPLNKVYALRDRAAAFVGDSGAMALFHREYHYDFAMGRYTAINELRHESIDGAADSSSDDVRYEFDYLAGPNHGAHSLLREFRAFDAHGIVVRRGVLTYGASGDPRTVSFVNRDGAAELFEIVYNERRLPIGVRSNTGVDTAIDYLADGSVRAINDASFGGARSVEFTYDPTSKLRLSEKTGDGYATHYRYGADYTVTSISTTSPDGAEVSHDRVERMRGGVTPNGSANIDAIQSAEAVGTLFNSTDGVGRVVKTAYDLGGGRFRSQVRAFNALGRLSRETGSFISSLLAYSPDELLGESGSDYAYDALGRLTGVRHDHAGNGLVDAVIKYGTVLKRDGAVNPRSVTIRRGSSEMSVSSEFDTREFAFGSGADALRYRETESPTRVAVSDARGNSAGRAIDGLGRTVETTSLIGGTMAISYDSRSEQTVRGAGGAVLRAERDPASKQVRFLRFGEPNDPDYRVIEHRYDTQGRLAELISPQHSIAFQRDGNGRVETTIERAEDGDEVTCRYEYDEHGRLERFSTEIPSGVIEQKILRDGEGRVERITSGNLIEGANPLGVGVRYSRDPLGDITAIEYPQEGRAERVNRFPNSRAVARIEIASTATGEIEQTVAFEYGSDGQLSKWSLDDKEGKYSQTKEAHTSAGLLASMIEESARGTRRITVGYNELGLPTTVTTGDNGGLSHYTYTPGRDYLVNRVEEGSRSSQWAYNALDRVTEERRANGHTTRCDYTSFGAVKSALLSDVNGLYSELRFVHSVLDPDAIFRTIYGGGAAPTVTRTTYCGGRVQRVKSAERELLFFHLRGPDAVSGSERTLGTLSYVLNGPPLALTGAAPMLGEKAAPEMVGSGSSSTMVGSCYLPGPANQDWYSDRSTAGWRRARDKAEETEAPPPSGEGEQDGGSGPQAPDGEVGSGNDGEVGPLYEYPRPWSPDEREAHQDRDGEYVPYVGPLFGPPYVTPWQPRGGGHQLSTSYENDNIHPYEAFLNDDSNAFADDAEGMSYGQDVCYTYFGKEASFCLDVCTELYAKRNTEPGRRGTSTGVEVREVCSLIGFPLADSGWDVNVGIAWREVTTNEGFARRAQREVHKMNNAELYDYSPEHPFVARELDFLCAVRGQFVSADGTCVVSPSVRARAAGRTEQSTVSVGLTAQKSSECDGMGFNASAGVTATGYASGGVDCEVGAGVGYRWNGGSFSMGLSAPLGDRVDQLADYDEMFAGTTDNEPIFHMSLSIGWGGE